MSLLAPYRDAVIGIPRNGIGAVSSLGLGQPDVIPLWFGEADIPTPAFIREAAKAALDDGQTYYTFSRGLPALRTEIQRWTRRFQDVDLDLERISVPGSAMMAVNIALQLTTGAQDNVVIIAPIWPNIFNAVRAMGASPRLVRLEPSKDAADWTLDLERVFAACDPRTRAIFICSPGNPTGWISDRSMQQALLDFARSRGIAIISDEVYGPLTYDEPAPSFSTLAREDDAVFIINSFSKAWAMTGWRIGWLVHPTKLGPWVAELANIDNTGSATFGQYGAIAALKDGDDFITAFRRRCAIGRDLVDKALQSSARLSWSKPRGAFYGFIRVDGLRDSAAFARHLVEHHRVGVAPGSAFGLGDDPDNEAYIRICFALEPDRLATALARIQHAAENWEG